MRSRLAAVLAAALSGVSLTLIAAPPAAATLPAPVILNDGAQNTASTQWAETQELPDDNGVRTFFATFLVQHAPGRTITNARADVNFNGTDDTGNASTNVGVTSQTFVGNAGGLETSKVSVAVNVGKPTGFVCSSSPVRTVDAPIRMRVVDSTGEVSPTTLTTTVRFVEDADCSTNLGFTRQQDYPRLTSASQSPSNGEVVPNGAITYTFTCDDVDPDVLTVTTDDNCDRAHLQWRRLDDGAVTVVPDIGSIADNTAKVLNLTAPASQGYYVLEAQFGNENNGYPQTQGPTNGWWRLGNAVVNDAAVGSLFGSLAFSGANLKASTPPSVNPTDVVNAVATVADLGGQVQVLEWNADNSTGATAFERFEKTIPTKTGGAITHAPLSTPQRTQAVDTGSAGVKTVVARITDNGALDAADSTRRQLQFSDQVRVNAVPIATDVPASTFEDTATTVTLQGNDPDTQPDPALTYTILTNPPASAGTLGPLYGLLGNKVDFTPAANFNGTTSFTYRVEDGTASTIGAHAPSNTATVTITVTPVNDTPVADPKTGTTNEDTPITIQATGSDVEDATLTWSVNSGPMNGGAVCTAAGACTYTPAANFNGTDSFVVKGTDSGGLSATATFTITVTAVNDAPVATDDAVTVPEDSVDFPITLFASDVDSATLTFTGPDDDVDHGTLSCVGAPTCTYTPAPDYNGPDSFTFTVSDGLLTDSGTITITVSPVNDTPVATDVPDAETDEDVTVSIPTTGTDVDNDPLTVSAVSDPPHGTATITGAATTDYLGDLNFNGIDVFDFIVTDGALSDTGHVSVTVHPVNDAPVVNDQTFHITEDTPALVSIAAGDVDGDVLHWSIVTPPTSGTLFGNGPDVGYSPNGNFNGTDTFVMQVDDGHSASDTAVITIIVDPVNDQPLANASSVTTNEDTSVNFTLDASDIDGDALTISAPVVGPFNGVANCSGTACNYQPNGNFHGADLFTFDIDDGHGGTDSASVSITVNSVNDPPVASPGSATATEDNSVAVNLVATDVDADILTYTTTSPAHGTLQGIAPNVVYVPNPNYFGPDGFQFTANDGHGGQDTQTVTIQVDSVNDAPIATGGSVTTPEETPVSFQLGGTDVENDTLTYTVTSGPAVGTLVCNPSGACTYTPPADYNGSAIIRYDVSDGQASDSGIFTVIVDPVNDPPVANNSITSIPEDTALSITLSASDTENDALVYAIESPPSHGGLVCSGGPSCVYTPAPNYNGGDAFTWSADDGHAGHTNATVSITVSPVNDAPKALDVSATTDEEVAKTFTLLASDVDGDPITYAIDTPPTNGTVTISGNQATYTPAIDFNGVDTFMFKAKDPSGASTVAKATITVDAIPLIGTLIVPGGATANVDIKLGVPLNSRIAVLQLSATLRKAVGTGPPFANRTLNFFVGTTLVCTGVTNANGFATCGSNSQGLAATLNLGYRVTFNGDADYSASAATGPLVVVNTVRL